MKTATLNKPVRPAISPRTTKRKNAVSRMKIRKILVPVDFSEASLAAIDRASRLATRFGAELNLVHVFEPQPPFVGTNDIPIYIPDAEAEVHAREHLRSVAEVHELPLRPEHIHVRKGRPYEEICYLARELGMDLIVIPTRGNTGWKHLALGSTAERVVRYSPCPVLIVRPGTKADENGQAPAGSVSFRNIVVPVDFSDFSREALDYAKNLAREFGSTLLLLHSVYLQYYVTNDEYARYDFPLVMEGLEKFAQEQMRELVRNTARDGIKVESMLEVGHAGEQICDRAKDRNADLIVTATHGRTGLKHALIGSTAEFVVRHASCPVLVVPTRSMQRVP